MKKEARDAYEEYHRDDYSDPNFPEHDEPFYPNEYDGDSD
jgi:hypothetical protein